MEKSNSVYAFLVVIGKTDPVEIPWEFGNEREDELYRAAV
jgi:hypothetical protein